MQIPKISLFICTLAVSGSLALHAQDNPAQAAARAALLDKLNELETAPAVDTPAPAPTAPPVQPAAVAPAAVEIAPTVAAPAATTAVVEATPNKDAKTLKAEAKAKAKAEKEAKLKAKKEAEAQQAAIAAEQKRAAEAAKKQAAITVDPKKAELARAKADKEAKIKAQKEADAQKAAALAEEKRAAEAAKKQAVLEAKKRAANEKAHVVTPVNEPAKELGLVQVNAPALPISPTKQEKLASLLQLYKADQLSPEEYQSKRAAIIAEP